MGIFNQEKAHELIPVHMHGGLERYLEAGILPGDFLTAVLENNLKEACGRADSINAQYLVQYVTYLYNYAPGASWGSPEKVQKWVDSFSDGVA